MAICLSGSLASPVATAYGIGEVARGRFATEDVATQNASAPAWSPVGTRLVFASNQDGDYDIYRVGLDGTGLERLTSSPALDATPVFSPAGDAVLFASDRDGDFELYRLWLADRRLEQLTFFDDTREDRPVFLPDGRLAFNSTRRTGLPDNPTFDSDVFVMSLEEPRLERVTHGARGDSYPAWSPDGTRMLFGSSRQGAWELYLADGEGRGAARIRTAPPGRYANFPSFSPDGQEFLYQSDRDGNGEIYRVSMLSMAEENLTATAHRYEVHPAWSPDGEWVAFVVREQASSGPGDLWVMRPDGTDPRHVPLRWDTLGAGVARASAVEHDLMSQCPDGQDYDDFTAQFSPDGSRIAFTSNRAGHADIYLVASDGGAPIRVTSEPSFDGYPAWSPDGAEIAFTSNRADGNWDIWRIDADGSDARRLTSHPGTDFEAPVFAHDGRRIMFYSDRDDPEIATPYWERAAARFGLYSLDRDSGAVSSLTDDPYFNRVSGRALAPDGDRIAYFSDAGDGHRLYVLDLASGRRTRVTDFLGLYGRWAPDGTHLLGVGKTDETPRDGPAVVDGEAFKANLEAFVVRPDGTGLRWLTDLVPSVLEAGYSPDGATILMTLHVAGRMRLFLMDADGERIRPLATSPPCDVAASVTSRGSKPERSVGGAAQATSSRGSR